MMYPNTRGPSSKVAADLGETDACYEEDWPVPESDCLPSHERPQTARVSRPRPYWQQRYEQWTHTDESREIATPIAYAPGTIATLPRSMQIAFRRKMLSIFALQLMVLTAFVASLTYDSRLSKWTRDTFTTTIALLGLFGGSIASLIAIYFVRTRFPLNWLMMAGFTIVLSVLVAGAQHSLDTPVGLFCCGYTLVTVCVMILLSGLSYRYHGDAVPSGPNFGQHSATSGEVVLHSSFVSGCISFAVSATIAGILYGLLDDFVSIRVMGYSLVLELVLMMWFSYDANSMYSIMTPDEYMSGVVYFYVDFIVLACTALFFAGTIFVAGTFCSTTSVGYCSCNCCLHPRHLHQEEIKVEGEEETGDTGGIAHEHGEDGAPSS